jgi:lipopolysaccharide transport system ATP-binding protein
MSRPIIDVQGIGKRYRIGARRERYLSLRDEIVKGFRRVVGRGGDSATDFWALRDVSFGVEEGDAVGIIGRNGAGKSTLLKILSKITPPTEGTITMRGRVASLLEVGTGFHPELTGRENIYLNGAILGMTRREIVRKFDEIVAFAEVDKFLDTPVKRYSSGMYVRLAFAVAAHLEPEILVVDEVLAVGDAEFQKKCLGKMGEVARGGRTVLFVSHNMSAIQALCKKTLLLHQGRFKSYGLTNDAVHEYLATAAPTSSFERPVQGNGEPTITKGTVSIPKDSGRDELDLAATILSDRSVRLGLDVFLQDANGTPIGLGGIGVRSPETVIDVRPGETTVRWFIDISGLALGSYVMSLLLQHPNVAMVDRVDQCLAFDVNRPPKGVATHVIDQRWGHGSVEFRTGIINVAHSPKADLPAS